MLTTYTKILYGVNNVSIGRRRRPDPTADRSPPRGDAGGHAARARARGGRSSEYGAATRAGARGGRRTDARVADAARPRPPGGRLHAGPGMDPAHHRLPRTR